MSPDFRYLQKLALKFLNNEKIPLLIYFQNYQIKRKEK